ncbi:hypothetical protein AOLI_G00302570 [Acnodon oligacanthus]
MSYRGTVESILSSCVIAWFENCTGSDRKNLQRIRRTAEKIMGSLSSPSWTSTSHTASAKPPALRTTPSIPHTDFFHCCRLAEGTRVSVPSLPDSATALFHKRSGFETHKD